MPKENVLHIFNPETDFALASGNPIYTPPKQILRLKNHLALVPCLYAGKNEGLLLPPGLNPDELPILPYYHLAIKKQIKFYRDVELTFEGVDTIKPWGWNNSLRNELLRLGAGENLLPSLESISTLRALSHRRTTIPFNAELNELLGIDAPLPSELKSMEEAQEFIRKNPDCFLKTPWSSSGRGILMAGRLEKRLEMEWLQGAFRRQGSVMGEIRADKSLDFATEWEIRDGESNFIGISIFNTTSGGSYLGNILLNQVELIRIFNQHSHIQLNELVDVQKKVLDHLISPYYAGPLGIDGCALQNSKEIRPCLEINLRHTMGYANLIAIEEGNIEI